MQIKTPDLGVDSADVSEILVKVGDTIEKEQSLLVLESAKASVEVPSPYAGTITKISINQGQSVKQGDVLFDIDRSDDEVEDEQATPQAERANTHQENQNIEESSGTILEQTAQPDHSAQGADGIQQVKVPDLGVDSADVSEILVKAGDHIAKEQSLLVLESAKASVEVPSPFAGVVQEVLLEAGQKVKQGMAILSLQVSPAADEQSSSDKSAKSSATEQQKNIIQKQDSKSNTLPDSAEVKSAAQHPLTDEQQDDNAKVYAGPAVRQLARQLGVALAQVKPSTANQRIVKQDVLDYVKTRLTCISSDLIGQRS